MDPTTIISIIGIGIAIWIAWRLIASGKRSQ
jgi:hypothetical protein